MDDGTAIALAIPAFLVLIVLEFAVSAWRGRRAFRLAEALACLGCGVGQQATALLWKAGMLVAYTALYTHLAPWSLSLDSPWTWAAGLLIVDHQYYWWHRASHRVRVMWASHQVHHQSEDYNLAVALRQEWLGGLTALPFKLPIALLGVPPVVWITAELIDLLYQFWIHTEQIDRLPAPFEAVFNTPSHHRVHHGVDPAYIDRNHGGILIVWDRLYGTFVAEAQRPTYGTVTPLRSVNPLWATVAPWAAIARELRAIPRWRDRIRHLLAPPEVYPEALGGRLEIPEPEPGRRTWDPQPPPALAAYVSVQFALLVPALVMLLLHADAMSWPARAVAVAWIVCGTAAIGGLIEGRAWARPVEAARLAVAVGLAAAWTPAPVVAAIGSVVVLSGAALAAIRGAPQDAGPATA